MSSETIRRNGARNRLKPEVAPATARPAASQPIVATRLAPVAHGVVQPLLLTADQAAAALAIGVRSLWRLVAAGHLRVVKLGASSRFAMSDLAAFVSGLQDGAGEK